MRKKLFSILALLLTVCGAWAQSNTEDTYIVAGSEPEIFGTSWDGSNQANQMVKGDGGKYSKAYTVDKAYKNVQLKVVKNNDEWFGDETGNNVEFKLTGAGTFTVIFDPDQNVASVAGEIVSTVNELQFETVYAVGNGNGEDNWLNGANWDPAYVENEMTEIADGVWEITFHNVPEGSYRQVKFALDGAWTHNFGGRFEDFGVQSDAVYNGDNIEFYPEDDCDITIQLDLSEFDFDTKAGAKFKINIVYPTDQTDISGATVTGIESSYDWTGNAIEPVPVVTLDGNVLSSETDYDVTYSEGCTDVGSYNVTITGKNNYTGTIVVTFTINNAYFLVGSFSEWQIDPDYKLVANPEAEDEYYINGVELSANDEFKVKSATSDWFPDGMDNAYVITANGTYDIYFRPKYDGGDDWYERCIYVADGTPIDYGETVEVTLAPTGYGTYYNSGKMVTLPTGVVAYAVSDVTGDQPTYVEIADGDSETNNTVPASTAMLLYCDATQNITLTLTESQDSYSGTNLLHGSDVQTTTTGGGDGAKYYKLTYGSVSVHKSIFGWYWGADNGGVFTSPAHKAWLVLPASNNARAFFNLPGDDATGIATIENKQQNADNVWYDLNGCRINAPKTKGIYVKDGRKLVIK